MRRIAAAALILLAPPLLGGCGGGGQSSPVMHSPVPTASGGAPLLTIGYTARPETAATRGSCSAGYMHTDPRYDAPGADFRCVYDSYSDQPITAAIGEAYAFSVAGTHCGIRTVQFDGRLFVADGSTVASGPAAGKDPFGTMTLLSKDRAKFTGRTGYVVTFHAATGPVQALGCA